MTFSFTGIGIEWFGNKDRKHGAASVYLDGTLVETVSAYSPTLMRQQRIFSAFSLQQGRHTLKIINARDKNSTCRGTVIDVDALVVT